MDALALLAQEELAAGGANGVVDEAEFRLKDSFTLGGGGEGVDSSAGAFPSAAVAGDSMDTFVASFAAERVAVPDNASIAALVENDMDVVSWYSASVGAVAVTRERRCMHVGL